MCATASGGYLKLNVNWNVPQRNKTLTCHILQELEIILKLKNSSYSRGTTKISLFHMQHQCLIIARFHIVSVSLCLYIPQTSRERGKKAKDIIYILVSVYSSLACVSILEQYLSASLWHEDSKFLQSFSLFLPPAHSTLSVSLFTSHNLPTLFW